MSAWPPNDPDTAGAAWFVFLIAGGILFAIFLWSIGP